MFQAVFRKMYTLVTVTRRWMIGHVLGVRDRGKLVGSVDNWQARGKLVLKVV